MTATSPSVAHLADRTVVVSAVHQGSGVLLTDRLVLTCAHVVKSGSVLIAHPALPDRVPAAVAWIDHRLDVALLEAAEPVRPVPPVRLGVVDTRQAIPGCEITGFPRLQRYGPDRRLEADHYTATVLPMAGRVRDLLVCDLDGPPAGRPDDEPAALSGLSGGPVFMGDVLLGIARQVPRQRDGRRVECVPLAPVLAANPFRLVHQRAGIDLRQERVHGSFPRDLRYEAEYARALGVAYRRTKIFGLDELSRHDSEWDLDTAYLSLEAQAQDRSTPGPPLPQRIDALLTGRPRVLLRGEAGAGKTTLLWWLAAHASARTLDDDLAPLNGLVPFVVPLRTLRARGGTFPGPAELSGPAGLVVDAAPEGWAGRVLEAGRALLLVDGLDEVPPEDREQAHTWLSQLLTRYPETRCVATVRPLAVEPDWLRSEGFGELRLLPMRNEDIQAFVTSWHRAARLSEQDDHERLDELERDVSRQFDQNATLRDLARTPLLCAVICALHRRRDGFLPETRWKLYRSALDMLLGHRDRRRRISDPEGIDLGVEEHTQLLQRIAVWLVREGQAEFTRDQALRQLGRALAGMERVRAQGPPEKILTHLLNRSGLLQENTDDTYQFIHRTFQDYLAAKELIEDDHLNELLLHADEESWQDVILLAAGHCDRRQLASLVGGLLNAGETHGRGTIDRTDLHVLAALCAQHATWLDGSIRDRVRDTMEALFPPADDDQVHALARLDESALAFLPPPGSLVADGPLAQRVVQLLGRIGGSAAIPYVRAWSVAHPSAVRDLTTNWSAFPPEQFAADVLAHYDLTEHFVLAQRAQLSALRRLPSLRHLVVSGELPEDELRAALAELRLHVLYLHMNPHLTDLSVLGAQAPTLQQLGLDTCPAARSLAPLAALPCLVALNVDMMSRPADFLSPMPGVPALRYLEISRLASGEVSRLPVHPGVSHLKVSSDRPVTLDGLAAWESLRDLQVSQALSLGHAVTAAREHTRITRLRLGLTSWKGPLSAGPPVTSLRELTITAPRSSADLALIGRLFPGLTHLTLTARRSAPELDLTPLRASPELRVTVRRGHTPLLLGWEELGDRLKVLTY
ncbi:MULTISPECIES: NACHT domain-containing protein [unclassified Streptomyces]|uniref:NACHT domain-containing protein n=1 Tax=unclassified Streptomyces TaxID=2593676 RepID=UPI0037A0D428